MFRVFVTALLVCAAAWAQQTTATLTGSITDASGALIPEVTVRATNVATNVSRVAQTDASGNYTIPFLVAGGYRISEPAADLAVAAALVSSLTGIALPADCVYFGEISLSGAIRPVAHAQQRLKEAEKLGFGQAVLPRGSEEISGGNGSGAFQPETLTDLVVRIAGPLRRNAED